MPALTRPARDDFLGGRLLLRQPERGVRAGSDAVLLAAAVPAQPGERVLELGCGAGAAMLCLAARLPGLMVTGLEIDAEAAGLAAANARQNGLADRVAVIAGDIADPPATLPAEGFDHVFANPPFFAAGSGTPAPAPGRAKARMAPAADLDGWLRFAARMLRPGGSVTVIGRAERLDDLLAACRRRFGAIVLFPLWPGGGKPAKRVILQGRKGSRAGLRLAPGLVLHGGGHAYTAAAEAVLRQGAALVLA
ncbi:MAG TPA: methyltransferase [Candidatus Sulfotelmatobacter sp.]|nr:methyltransferase [Candidatus Sulfotelmatobacter sp.]